MKVNQASQVRFIPFTVCKIYLNKIILYNEYIKKKRNDLIMLINGHRFFLGNEIHTRDTWPTVLKELGPSGPYAKDLGISLGAVLVIEGVDRGQNIGLWEWREE